MSIMNPDALCTVFELMFDIRPDLIQIMRYGEKFYVKPITWDESNILALLIGYTEDATSSGKLSRIHGVIIKLDINEDVYDIIGGNEDIFGILPF